MNLGNFLSIIIFIIVSLLFSFLISMSSNIKKTKKYFVIFVVALSFMSYIFKPLSPIDLTRLQESLSQYKDLLFIDMLLKIPETSDFCKLIYFWIISKTQINNLLQLGAVIVYYSIMFYIIYDYSKNHNINTKILGIALMNYMLFGQFIFVVSGIRTAMAFAIFFLAYYREYFKGKSIFSNIFFYVVSIGFHTAVIPIIIIRIIFVVFDNRSKKMNKYVNILITVCLVFFVIYYGDEIINSFVDTLNTYINNQIFYNKPEYFLASLKCIFISLIVYVGYKLRKIDDNIIEMKQYKKFIFITIIITFIFSYQYTIFTRYTYFLEMLILPLYIAEVNHMKKIQKNKYAFTLYEFFINLIILCIAIFSYSKANASMINFF